MTENIRAIADLMRDREREGLALHPALAIPGWAAQYLEVEDDEQEVCDWCEQPITEDTGTSYCRGTGEYLHPQCHYESGCRRND